MIRFEEIEDEEQFERVVAAEWWGGFGAGVVVSMIVSVFVWAVFSGEALTRWLFR